MLFYNSKKIIPAPFVEIAQEYVETPDGKKIASLFTISLSGTIVASKGSPNSSGVFWTLSDYPPDEVLTADQKFASILRKQEALQKLFAEEGKTLEIQPWDGSPPVKCNPRIKRVSFSEGNWTEVCQFRVEMEADVLYLGDEQIGISEDYRVSQISNNWSIEPADETNRTYRLTHNVSATGKRFYDETGTLVKQAWEQAKDYVLNVISLGLTPARMEAPGVLNASSLQAFNYVRNNQIDEVSGTFSVTETWLCYDPQGEPPAVEDFTVNTRFTENGITTVSIDGTITGLEVRDNNTHGPATSTKWTNAYNKWANYIFPNLLTRCQNLSNLSLNPFATSANVGFNNIQGVITYNYEFNNRPTSVFTGSRSEVITISDRGSSDIFASIPIIGRASGPILQSMFTISSKQRTISIEIVMPGATIGYTPIKPNTNSLVISYIPVSSQVFLEQNDESWSPTTGRYSRTVVYTYE